MNIPYSWCNGEINSLIDEESLKLRCARELISERFGLDSNEIVRTDLDCVAMPEILSAQYCILSENHHLLGISPPLQAFLAYAISIYDTISDNHLYKNEEPTFLKMYGLNFVLLTEKIYKKVIRELSKELEREIPEASRIVKKMYSGTIKADKSRNRGILSPEEAITLQERIAGEHAYNIAVLSNAKKLGHFSYHLVNAMTTLEDLIDLFYGEDFTGVKTTIPIAFLSDEFGRVVEDYQIIKKSLAIRRTKEYINDQISSSRDLLSNYSSEYKSFLLKIIESIDNFNKKFPEDYL